MNKVLTGNSLDVLKTLKDNSVDSVVTDPPYGYSFMGKDWDKAVPSVEIWQECLRVLKPGAFCMVMSAPRSDVQMHMISNLEQAGFRIDFTPIYWTYASGFPKAGNIGKLVDKRLGVERPDVKHPGFTPFGEGTPVCPDCNKSRGSQPGNCRCRDIKSTPNTPQAKALDGSYAGFQPKPAVEVIIVAMKPLSEKTFVDQALKNGRGITWLDDVRSPFGDETDSRIGTDAKAGGSQESQFGTFSNIKDLGINMYKEGGRFPANLLVDDNVLGDHSKFFTLPFLITPKASKREKNEGLSSKITERPGARPSSPDSTGKFPDHDHRIAGGNNHPTVKPLKLMSYLITLTTREGDTVLDPFCGSGTTCIAAKMLKREYIGIEREAEYVEIAEARLKAHEPDPQLELLDVG